MKLSEFFQNQPENIFRYTGSVWGSEEDLYTGSALAESITAMGYDNEIGNSPDDGYYIQSGCIRYTGHLMDEVVVEPVEQLTTGDMAQVLGVSIRRVQALAARRGVGRRFGKALLFTPEDVTRLRPGKTGHPKK